MKQVEADSQGKVSMGAGTLYGSLKRMLDAGLVEESDKRVDPVMDDERRIYYRITGVGAKALEAELERYKRIVTVAQERKLSKELYDRINRNSPLYSEEASPCIRKTGKTCRAMNDFQRHLQRTQTTNKT
jgi:DNA-binding PadR family transcriptional regulator